MGSACAAPADDKKGGGATKYKESASSDSDQLAGKSKYIGDVGAVVMMHEDKRVGNTIHVLCFISTKMETVFTLHQSKNDAYYVKAFADDALMKLKDECQVSFSSTAVYKSIATDIVKGKAKYLVKDDSASIEFSVTSVKDAKSVQKLTIPLKRETGDSLAHPYLILPLAWMVQKRRLNNDDKDKELKTSKLQTQTQVQDAAIHKHKGTVDRISPIIVSVREESAAHGKSSSELVAKIASVERKIRKLNTASEKNPVDGVYEDGGARYYSHCADAEEHIPQPKYTDEYDALLSCVKAKLPLKEGEEITAITKAPEDPSMAQFWEKCPADMRDGTLKALQKLDEWDMSVFDLEKSTDGNALATVTYALLYKLDLINRLKLDDKILRLFLTAVQSGYHPNPYHNATHAADVAQINYFIMIRGGLADKCKLSQEEILGGVLAGSIHDFDHPGFNNNFHTRTNAYLSTLYNDRSILENHHLACVFEMLRLAKYNILSHFKEEQYREVRDTMTEMVLATDMGLHGKIFSSFRRRLGECPEWHERKDDVRLALSMSIKMADISNCGRPKFLYLEWAKNIASEFYNQGDVEQKLCIPISPFMDRRKDRQEFPKGQISFMNFIVVPMFEAISEFLPPVECSLQFCTENKEYWQQQE